MFINHHLFIFIKIINLLMKYVLNTYILKHLYFFFLSTTTLLHYVFNNESYS